MNDHQSRQSRPRGSSPDTRGARADAPAPPGISDLQAQAGNAAVSALLAEAQPKLMVGSSDDPLEQQADRLADRIVAGRSSSEAVSPATGRLQRDGGDAASETGGELDASDAAAIRGAAGGGRPLDPSFQRTMEEALDADLSRVRLHDGPRSQALNEAMGARASTLGSDIHFRDRLPDPAVPDEARLLAHEVVHTVQQTSSRAPVAGEGTVQRFFGERRYVPLVSKSDFIADPGRRRAFAAWAKANESAEHRGDRPPISEELLRIEHEMNVALQGSPGFDVGFRLFLLLDLCRDPEVQSIVAAATERWVGDSAKLDPPEERKKTFSDFFLTEKGFGGAGGGLALLGAVHGKLKYRTVGTYSDYSGGKGVKAYAKQVAKIRAPARSDDQGKRSKSGKRGKGDPDALEITRQDDGPGQRSAPLPPASSAASPAVASNSPSSGPDPAPGWVVAHGRPDATGSPPGATGALGAHRGVASDHHAVRGHQRPDTPGATPSTSAAPPGRVAALRLQLGDGILPGLAPPGAHGTRAKGIPGADASARGAKAPGSDTAATATFPLTAREDPREVEAAVLRDRRNGAGLDEEQLTALIGQLRTSDRERQPPTGPIDQPASRADARRGGPLAKRRERRAQQAALEQVAREQAARALATREVARLDDYATTAATEAEYHEILGRFGADERARIEQGIKDYTNTSTDINLRARGMAVSAGKDAGMIDKLVAGLDGVIDAMQQRGFTDKERVVYRLATYRGTTEIPYGSTIGQGDLVADKAFVSTSENRQLLREADESRKPGVRYVKFTIVGSGGANISGGGPYTNMTPEQKKASEKMYAKLPPEERPSGVGQAEILFGRGTVFRVERIEPDGVDTLVVLTRVPPEQLAGSRFKNLYDGTPLSLT